MMLISISGNAALHWPAARQVSSLIFYVCICVTNDWQATAAVRVVSNSRKYDRGLTQFRRQTLHWLDVADRIRFRLCVQVYKCQHGMAPAYLEELCWPVSDIDGRRHLRSARRGLLDVPRVELSTYGRRSFSYAGPSAWNALPDYLKNSTLSLSVFRNQLKHFLFSSY